MKARQKLNTAALKKNRFECKEKKIWIDRKLGFTTDTNPLDTERFCAFGRTTTVGLQAELAFGNL